MASIWFTGNHEDLSTDRGYQFNFYCEKCGNGYVSTFKASAIGMAASAVRVAGSLFGGIFGNAASSTYEVQRAIGGAGHGTALEEAADEISKQFNQCTRCGKWVCEPICWNRKMQLCESCAPDLDEEIGVEPTPMGVRSSAPSAASSTPGGAGRCRDWV